MVTQRRVAVRTVASAQAASQAAGAGVSPVTPPAIQSTAPDTTGTFRPESITYTPSRVTPSPEPSQLDDFYKTIDPYADVGIPLAPAVAERQPDAYSIGGVNPPPVGPISGLTPQDPQYWEQYGEAIQNMDLLWRPAVETNIDLLRGLVDENEVRASMESTWLNMETIRVTNKALADQMIADAVDQAAQPYDEKLIGLDRDINEVYGKMDDLEKITDYYQASIVEPWERAAEAGRNSTGDDLRAQIAPRVAEIGKGYDLAKEGVQDYLDRIGGVPMAQQVAIHDGISELQSPYEGLTRAEASTLASVADARGTLFEKQAIWGKANELWESEKSRFITGSSLDRTLKAMEQDRDDIIGFRARAVARAERQAEQQYGYTEQMPSLEEFQGFALADVGTELGLDTFETQQLMGNFNSFLDGTWVNSGFGDLYAAATGIDPSTLQITPLRTLDALEQTLSIFGSGEDGAFLPDFQNLMYTMASWQEAERSWQERNRYFTGGGKQHRGGQAPDNLANRDAPDYLQRKAMVTEMQNVITSNFNVTSNGMGDQMRWEVDPNNTAQDPNSDHLSGGALDIWPVGNDLAEVDRLEKWLETQPNVSFTRWRESGHYDHLHVSFLLPDQIGGGAPVNESYAVPTGELSILRAEEQIQSALDGVDDTTRSLLQSFLGYEGTL